MKPTTPHHLIMHDRPPKLPHPTNATAPCHGWQLALSSHTSGNRSPEKNRALPTIGFFRYQPTHVKSPDGETRGKYADRKATGIVTFEPGLEKHPRDTSGSTAGQLAIHGCSGNCCRPDPGTDPPLL